MAERFLITTLFKYVVQSEDERILKIGYQKECHSYRQQQV